MTAKLRKITKLKLNHVRKICCFISAMRQIIPLKVHINPVLHCLVFTIRRLRKLICDKKKIITQISKIICDKNFMMQCFILVS